jgi:hypothetical protein
MPHRFPGSPTSAFAAAIASALSQYARFAGFPLPRSLPAGPATTASWASNRLPGACERAIMRRFKAASRPVPSAGDCPRYPGAAREPPRAAAPRCRRHGRLADQLVHRARPVELRGVDVVHPGRDGHAQHPQRLVAIPRRPEDPVAGELHRAVPGPAHPPRAERERPAEFLSVPAHAASCRYGPRPGLLRVSPSDLFRFTAQKVIGRHQIPVIYRRSGQPSSVAVGVAGGAACRGPADRRPSSAEPETETLSATRMANPSTVSGAA